RQPWLHTAVEHVATGGPDLTLELARGATIRGVLVDASGAPLYGYEVVARGAAEERAWSAATDAEGAFAVSVPADSAWDLEVHAAPQSGIDLGALLRLEGIAAGTEGLVLQLSKPEQR